MRCSRYPLIGDLDEFEALQATSHRETFESNQAPLTPRELDIARLLCQGLSNKEIGRALVLELTTVKAHVTRILTKTNSQNRTQVALALVRQLATA